MPVPPSRKDQKGGSGSQSLTRIIGSNSKGNWNYAVLVTTGDVRSVFKVNFGQNSNSFGGDHGTILMVAAATDSRCVSIQISVGFITGPCFIESGMQYSSREDCAVERRLRTSCR
jgi:hypothetical protein